MSINTKTLEKIRTLRADATKLSGFHENFAAKYGSDPGCDKKGLGFGKDSRFAAFNINTSFDSWTGYYGNSSCSRALGGGEQVEHFIVKAMNVHQKEIFATAAKLMREEAATLTATAADELSELQKMLTEASVVAA